MQHGPMRRTLEALLVAVILVEALAVAGLVQRTAPPPSPVTVDAIRVDRDPASGAPVVERHPMTIPVEQMQQSRADAERRRAEKRSELAAPLLIALTFGIATGGLFLLGRRLIVRQSLVLGGVALLLGTVLLLLVRENAGAANYTIWLLPLAGFPLAWLVLWCSLAPPGSLRRGLVSGAVSYLATGATWIIAFNGIGLEALGRPLGVLPAAAALSVAWPMQVMQAFELLGFAFN